MSKQPKPCDRCAQMPYISPGFICHTEGCRWAITAEKLRQPKESDMAEKAYSERDAFEKWADENGFGFKFRESMFAAWEGRAHLAQPKQAVDVRAIREVIADLKSFPASDRSVRLSNALTRAIGNARTIADSVDPLVVRLGEVTTKLEALIAMRNEWERDAREHLNTFGQHMPASLECLVEKFDAALREKPE